MARRALVLIKRHIFLYSFPLDSIERPTVAPGLQADLARGYHAGSVQVAPGEGQLLPGVD